MSFQSLAKESHDDFRHFEKKIHILLSDCAFCARALKKSGTMFLLLIDTLKILGVSEKNEQRKLKR